MKRTSPFVYYAFFILSYTTLYFTTGMILFNYEGTWDQSTGELWSFGSMTWTESIAYVLWYIPAFPFGLIIQHGLINLFAICVANPVLVGWTLQRIFRRHRSSVLKYGTRINIALTTVIIASWITYFAIHGF
jgi:hypothetical protein